MTVRRLAACGTPLAALLIFAPHAAAQASAPRLTTLYSFQGNTDSSSPSAGVTIGNGGVLYGTTQGGGSAGTGTVFSLTPPASAGGTWTEAVLHDFSFSGVSDGNVPSTGLVIGSGGVLYGTAFEGGTGSCFGGLIGCGTVFSLTPPASPGGAWTVSVLYSFQSSSGNPVGPGNLAISKGGVLYGTTSGGGAFNSGTVFALRPPGSAGGPWTERVLYNFTGGADGAGPAGVVIGSGGVLYGTTFGGGTLVSCPGTGASGCGTVFSLTPPTSPGRTWTEAVLYNFMGGADGAGPSPVVIGSGGVLYGTTYYDGVLVSCPGTGTPGCGTVFSLTPPTSPGGVWTEAALHSFTGAPGDGSNPSAVAISNKGVLYGKTYPGGTSGYGTVFSLSPPPSPGGAWTETVLHNFTGGADGANPTGVAVSKGGVLFGTTFLGGTGPSCYSGSVGCGTVFALKP